jgi:hypothetical protein
MHGWRCVRCAYAAVAHRLSPPHESDEYHTLTVRLAVVALLDACGQGAFARHGGAAAVGPSVGRRMGAPGLGDDRRACGGAVRGGRGARCPPSLFAPVSSSVVEFAAGWRVLPFPLTEGLRRGPRGSHGAPYAQRRRQATRPPIPHPAPQWGVRSGATGSPRRRGVVQAATVRHNYRCTLQRAFTVRRGRRRCGRGRRA